MLAVWGFRRIVNKNVQIWKTLIVDIHNKLVYTHTCYIRLCRWYFFRARRMVEWTMHTKNHIQATALFLMALHIFLPLCIFFQYEMQKCTMHMHTRTSGVVFFSKHSFFNFMALVKHAHFGRFFPRLYILFNGVRIWYNIHESIA